jgi:NAD(P)-dependent dehydrogenase (short-subunit alcohol dehydrogenase family)
METSVTHTALLAHKRAVIFGAGGAVGSAVAREFAAQRATVFLSGRRRSAVEQVVTDIQRSGGSAHAAEVGISEAQVVSRFEQATLLKRLPTVTDTARLAAFLASDSARTITGDIVNASSGSVID